MKNTELTKILTYFIVYKIYENKRPLFVIFYQIEGKCFLQSLQIRTWRAAIGYLSSSL